MEKSQGRTAPTRTFLFSLSREGLIFFSSRKGTNAQYLRRWLYYLKCVLTGQLEW